MLKFSRGWRNKWVKQLTGLETTLFAISRHRRLKPEEEVKLGKAVQKMSACLEVKQRLSKDGQEISKEQWATEVGCSEAELA